MVERDLIPAKLRREFDNECDPKEHSSACPLSRCGEGERLSLPVHGEGGVGKIDPCPLPCCLNRRLTRLPRLRRILS